MATTLTTSGAVTFKAGENYDKSITEADWTRIINDAEDYISALSRYDWVGNWGTISGAAGAKVASEACSNLAAIYAINFNMAGYTSRAESELMIKVLYKRAMDCIKLLQDQKGVDFIT